MNAVSTKSIKVPNNSTPVRIELGGEVVWASLEDWGAKADALVAKHGGVPKVVNTMSTDVAPVVQPPVDVEIPAFVNVGAVVSFPLDGRTYNGTIIKVGKFSVLIDLERDEGQAKAHFHELTLVTKGPKENSSFGGKLVVDEEAKKRIEATNTKLDTAGVKVNANEQYYASGTRMADIGYATQAKREKEYRAMHLIGDVAAELTKVIKAERRVDIEMSAGDLGKSLRLSGNRIQTKAGLSLSEQAIRGLLARVESPALAYVLGLRDRIAETGVEDAEATEKRTKDLSKIVEVLAHECWRHPNVTLKARAREGVGDIFAFVSPTYGVADAPDVLPHIVNGMPKDARGAFNYDAGSTSWEVRANIWTPTAVSEQAVGEAFKGYISFTSRDNGTRRLRGGGGIELLRCLNASTYNAADTDVSRAHRGRILYDIESAVAAASKAIDVLCEAWGTCRRDEVDIPESEDGPIPIEQAIPGFWRFLLRDRSSELVGVLPGRSADHADGLTKAFFAERRESETLVKSDFAHGWTKYIQKQSAGVRRDGEAAIATWLVNDGVLEYAEN
jgi:hypothetical protein